MKGDLPMDENNKMQDEVLDEQQTDEETADAALIEDDDEAAASEYNDTALKYDAIEEALQEANEKYVRLFAEYDNYRKRTAKEKTETYNNATSNCIEKLLPVVDGFERSLEFECADENFRSGMMMIFNQMKDILTKMGVSEIEALGKEFDPNVHNAISQQAETDYASGHVCQVFQKGYKLGDKLIRPAMVAVAE